MFLAPGTALLRSSRWPCREPEEPASCNRVIFTCCRFWPVHPSRHLQYRYVLRVGSIFLAQLSCGCRKMLHSPGERLHVVIEYLTVDVVDTITRLMVAAVVDLAGRPSPGGGRFGRLRFCVPVFGAANWNSGINEWRFVVSSKLNDLRGRLLRRQLVGEHLPDGRRACRSRGLRVIALAALSEVAAVRRRTMSTLMYSLILSTVIVGEALDVGGRPYGPRFFVAEECEPHHVL